MPPPPTPDPGWGGPRTVAFALIPFVGAQMSKRARNGLVAGRLLFLNFCGAIVLVGVVVLILGTDSRDAAVDAAVAAAVVAVAGLGAVVIAPRVGPVLDGSSAAQLASSFRTRFFLRLAVGEVPALLGFVALFVANSEVPYFVGAAFTAATYVRTAPSQAHLAADQAGLRDRKCDLDLIAVLSASGR